MVTRWRKSIKDIEKAEIQPQGCAEGAHSGNNGKADRSWWLKVENMNKALQGVLAESSR